MKTEEQLINNIIGQLNGINKMIAEGQDCFSVIIQVKAVKSATNSFLNKYMEENVLKCLDKKHIKQNKLEIKKLLLEINKNN